jgi:formate/nitrite transporter FocA (FNT family)
MPRPSLYRNSTLVPKAAPGLIRTAGALLFQIGLVMIVLTGGDLFTFNILFMTTALLHR